MKPLHSLLPTFGIEPADDLAALRDTITTWARNKGLTIDTISLRHNHLQLYTDPATATVLHAGREELLDHLFIHHTGLVDQLTIRARIPSKQPKPTG